MDRSSSRQDRWQGWTSAPSDPEEFLLDGQQRLTTLCQALFSQSPVQTKTDKKQKIERYYYVDIQKALAQGADYEAMIVGVPADRIVRQNFGRDIVLDVSTPEAEYANHPFPFEQGVRRTRLDLRLAGVLAQSG